MILTQKPIHKLVITNDNCESKFDFLGWLIASTEEISLARTKAKKYALNRLNELDLTLLPFKLYIEESDPVTTGSARVYEYYVRIEL